MNKFTSDFHADLNAITARVKAALGQENDAALAHDLARFDRLARMFRLGAAERDLLHCLIACHTDPALYHRFAEQSGFAYVTEYLVRRLFDHGPAPIYASDSPLNLWQLVHARDMGPGQPVALELDLAVLEWLAGKPGLEPRLIKRLSRPEPAQRDGDTAAFAPFLAAVAQHVPVICLVAPGDGGDIATTMAAITAQTGLAIWCVRDSATPLSDLDILKIHRFAHVQGAGLFWAKAAQDCLDPVLVPGAQVQIGVRQKGVRITPPHSTRIIALDPLTTPQPQAAQIARKTEALQDWAVALPTHMGFNDLVLEPGLKTALRGFVAEIRAHADLWQDAEVARVYAQERALTALLQGPPGTGKTLTARVLAAEAGMPLYRVDAASLTSKYIGETAENMRALFDAANGSGAMLFIDEFDAIVGKRTETRNEIARSYNHDTAYFLQLIETRFDGVALFASNRPMDIDEAMHRRIRKVFDFQLPEAAERRALWQLALQPFGPSSQVIAFSLLLAESFAFTGSRIKAVVLNAVALAPQGGPRVTVPGLRSAALAEARANGRLPARRELQQLESFGTGRTQEDGR
ncbi:ATP-binding protein [Yoonia vestfoldensis]|uniref:ATP-binding protein n=1 Tax=Yoonia vestfoldensis TaxID=245188 RepID=UPI00037D7863|nr:ATP-binding protein [Yoonia vestfoldensis]